MWWQVYASMVSAFVLCSWLWGVGLPYQLHSREVITAQLEVSVVTSRLAGGRVVPTFMLDLYRQFNGGGRPRAADVIRSFMPKNTGSLMTRGLHLKERRHLLVFEVPAPGPGEVLEAAELRVLTMGHGPSSADAGRPVTVSLLDDEAIDITSQPGNHQDAWVTFNVTSSVMRCNPRRRMTLRLVVRLMGGGDLVVGVVADVQPLLLLSYSTTKASSRAVHHHQKRSVETEDYEEETNSLWDDDMMSTRLTSSGGNSNRKMRRMRNMCRRRPLYVDFSVIHYDTWIVAPSGYEAFQCLGKCFFPVGEHLSPTKHAIVQTLLHSVAPGSVARACCVPTRLEPISVLYIDHRGVLTYRFSYQDMVVAECGCR